MPNPTFTVSENPRLQEILGAMEKFAIDGGRSPKIILLAQQICQKVTSGDYASEVLAINYWVCQNIRYVPDPTDVELVKDAERLVQTGSGDCDDIAVLCAALLRGIGKTVAFMMVAFKGSPMPSHIFAVVKTPTGWVPVDPVANRVTNKMMRDATKKWIVPIDGSSGVSESSMQGPGQPVEVVGPSTVFSVFDYAKNSFSYYNVGASTPPTAWFRRPVQVAGAVQPGAARTFTHTEVLAVRLPPTAVLIGTGPDARGVIATTSTSMGANNPAGDGKPNPASVMFTLLAGIFLGLFIGSTEPKRRPDERWQS